jgi:hypothetical protein
MTACPECGRPDGHSIHCSRGRCARCGRAPAIIQGWCLFCWKAVRRERAAIVAERLDRLGPEREDGL